MLCASSNSLLLHTANGLADPAKSNTSNSSKVPAGSLGVMLLLPLLSVSATPAPMQDAYSKWGTTRALRGIASIKGR